MFAGLWLLALSVVFTLKRNTKIMIIPASLALLLLSISFGPWGVGAVSVSSQKFHFENILNKYDLISNGRIVKAETEVSFEDRKRISSIISYFCDSGYADTLKPYFIGLSNFDKRRECNERSLVKVLGFDYVRENEKSQNDVTKPFNLNDSKKKSIDIQKYDFFVPNISLRQFQNSNNNQMFYKIDAYENVFVELDIENNLLFRDGNILLSKYNLDAFINERIGKNNETGVLFLQIENEKITTYIDFNSIRGEIREKKPIIKNVGFDLFLKLKEKK